VVLGGTLDNLLASYGYLAVFALVGIESLGIPLPGETLLITAGIYAGTTHHLTVEGIIAAATPARSSATTSATRSATGAACRCCAATGTTSASTNAVSSSAATCS
jgi:hypothetical protein